MPPTLQMTSDPSLDGDMIVASFRTARELRAMFHRSTVEIVSSLDHDDDLIRISPGLYDRLCRQLDELTCGAAM